VARASDLELGLGFTLADLDQLGIGTTGLLEEIADIGNLLWHDGIFVSNSSKVDCGGCIHQPKMAKLEELETVNKE
jgi:hypothetical protein